MDPKNMQEEKAAFGFVAGGKWLLTVTGAFWMGLERDYRILVILMGFDLLTGGLAAMRRGKFCEWRMFFGIVRKVVIWVVVYCVHLMSDSISGHLGKPFDLAPVAAASFMLTEFASIMRNAAVFGVTLPKALTDAFNRFRSIPPATE